MTAPFTVNRLPVTVNAALTKQNPIYSKRLFLASALA